jgi:pyruvate,water dikinase
MMGMYNNMLKSILNKRSVDFNNFDLTEGMDGIHEYDPATHLKRLNAQFRALPSEVQKKMREMSYADSQKTDEAGDFPKKVADLVSEFGHLSDNGNDFSTIPWREQPELVLQLVMDFESPKEDGKKVTLSDLKAKGQVNYPFKLFYKRAREFRLLREQVSGLYTHGYGLFRYYFLALGKHFANRGLIDLPEDVFYLTYSQARELVNGRQPVEDLRGEIAKHKTDMERFTDILVPTVIYGDDIPPVREPNMDVLTGIPTSIGHYTGKVKVVKGIQDFSKVQKGDVLVVPYSDVGWTPLFAKAGAVVSESGGLLSHSSIVAREYNIPAVVSVEGATLMPDETTVTVDGHKGEVLIHK